MAESQQLTVVVVGMYYNNANRCCIEDIAQEAVLIFTSPAIGHHVGDGRLENPAIIKRYRWKYVQ